MSDLLRDPVLSLVILLSALGIAQGFLLLALIMTLRQIRRQIRALYRTRRAWEFSMEQTTTYFQALDLLKRSGSETAEDERKSESSVSTPAPQRLRLG
jgi:hypothetical protein